MDYRRSTGREKQVKKLKKKFGKFWHMQSLGHSTINTVNQTRRNSMLKDVQQVGGYVPLEKLQTI